MTFPRISGWLDSAPGRDNASPESRSFAPPANGELVAELPGAHIVVAGGDVVVTQDGVICAVAGRPAWQDPDLAAISRQHGDARALAEAYRRSGPACVEVAHGPCTLAIADTRRNRLVLSADRSGRNSVYHATTPSRTAFGSSAGSVAVLTGQLPRLDPQQILHYLYFSMIPAPGCIYAGISKLAAAHSLTVDAGQAETRRYWTPTFSESLSMSVPALQEQLRELFYEIVAEYADTDAPGAFLSGGVDSSTVAGMLARARPGDANTFSIGFDVEQYNELEYARLVSRHFGTTHHEYNVTPDDVADLLPQLALAYDEPFGNSSAIPTFYCAKMAAEHGVKRMLAGDGGDEIFAGNTRYAKQWLFGLYGKMPGWLRDRLLPTVLAASPGSFPPVRKLQRYVEQARVPLPDRLQGYNFVVTHTPEAIFSDDLLARMDTGEPLALQRKLFRAPDDASDLNRMLYMDWQHTLADNDVRKVTGMCTLAGVDVAYPFLDERIVDFSSTIPSARKMRRTRLRYFYKEAMRGFLPDAVLTKSKQGFGLPFGVWLRSEERLLEIARPSLDSLSERGIFRPEFVSEATRLHAEEHAGYHGELTWLLLSLELWLQAHGNPGW